MYVCVFCQIREVSSHYSLKFFFSRALFVLYLEAQRIEKLGLLLLSHRSLRLLFCFVLFFQLLFLWFFTFLSDDSNICNVLILDLSIVFLSFIVISFWFLLWQLIFYWDLTYWVLCYELWILFKLSLLAGLFSYHAAMLREVDTASLLTGWRRFQELHLVFGTSGGISMVLQGGHDSCGSTLSSLIPHCLRLIG